MLNISINGGHLGIRFNSCRPAPQCRPSTCTTDNNPSCRPNNRDRCTPKPDSCTPRYNDCRTPTDYGCPPKNNRCDDGTNNSNPCAPKPSNRIPTASDCRTPSNHGCAPKGNSCGGTSRCNGGNLIENLWNEGRCRNSCQDFNSFKDQLLERLLSLLFNKFNGGSSQCGGSQNCGVRRCCNQLRFS